MTEFLSTDEFSIYKNEKDNTMFTIEFTISSESLINSMIKTKQIIEETNEQSEEAITAQGASRNK